MPTATSKPPGPRRCLRILEAHHLSCRGFSLSQIAEEMHCARSTAHAYLRDYRLYSAHILRTVAAARLADQVYLLSQPDPDPARHRQHVAAARELRLLLTAMPRLEEIEELQRHPALRPLPGETAEEAKARAHAHEWETRIDPDGHERYLRGPKQGECQLFCSKCLDRIEAELEQRFADRLDEPGSIESEPDQSPTIQDESGPIQTDLDKSEHLEREFPAPDDEFPPILQNSPLRRPPRSPRPPRPDRWPEFIPPKRGNRVHVVPLPDIGRL